jgi:hypothetical protein
MPYLHTKYVQRLHFSVCRATRSPMWSRKRDIKTGSRQEMALSQSAMAPVMREYQADLLDLAENNNVRATRATCALHCGGLWCKDATMLRLCTICAPPVRTCRSSCRWPRDQARRSSLQRSSSASSQLCMRPKRLQCSWHQPILLLRRHVVMMAVMTVRAPLARHDVR